MQHATSELANFFYPDLVPGETYDLANIVVLIGRSEGLPPMALRITGLPGDAPTEQIETWISSLKRVAAAVPPPRMGETGVVIGPLDGIIVVDLSRALAGPYCTALLADLGATVIKVENLGSGDTARQWPPFEGEHSLYFDSVNRNKRSVCVDFYAPEGREVLERLIGRADVLVENFKLGTLDKLGLTTERLDRAQPSPRRRLGQRFRHHRAA